MATQDAGDGGGGRLGVLLRHWRGLRGLSQLDLALEAEISQRHLSFLESGRGRPSRRMVDRLAEVLDLPLRDRNDLRLAAGFAPGHPDGDWDAEEMGVVTAALRRMLDQQEPFPAVVLDRGWNVVMANAAAPRLFGAFVDLAARPKPRNLLHLMFDPKGLRPFVDDWATTSAMLLARVRREAVGGVVDEELRALVASLKRHGDAPDVDLTSETPGDRLPVVPIGLRLDGTVLRYFSLVATVGAPATVLSQELRLECMFPADAATEALHRSRFGGGA